jgi:hypothetical protein
VTTMSRPMNRRTVRSFLLRSSGPRSSARPNPRTQPTGRKGARCHSGGALRKSRLGSCGRGHDGPQLMRKSLTRQHSPQDVPGHVEVQCPGSPHWRYCSSLKARRR